MLPLRQSVNNLNLDIVDDDLHLLLVEELEDCQHGPSHGDWAAVEGPGGVARLLPPPAISFPY